MTVSVSDLPRSKAFYEGVRGFIPDAYYEPTRWQPHKFDGRAYFAIMMALLEAMEAEPLWETHR